MAASHPTTPGEEHDVTRLLKRWQSGDAPAGDELFRLVYDTLHSLAERAMSRERPDHTLRPTALVNEAYLRLAGGEVDLNDSSHFLALSARVMRRLLVDHARARSSEKRGGGRVRVTLNDRAVASSSEVGVEGFEAAMRRLESFDPRKARLIELRHLAGMSTAAIAQLEGVSERTVRRDLRLGRAWLQSEMRP